MSNTGNVSSSSSSGGVGVVGLLGVAFVVLKLCGVINWSWWWVTLPFWGGFVLFLAILLIGALIGGSVVGISSLLENRRLKQQRKRLDEFRKNRNNLR